MGAPPEKPKCSTTSITLIVGTSGLISAGSAATWTGGQIPEASAFSFSIDLASAVCVAVRYAAAFWATRIASSSSFLTFWTLA